MDNQVVITYKRKRFSSERKSSPRPLIGVSSTPRRSSPKVEFNDDNEKQKKEYLSCFKCGNSDVDENLIRCECCFKMYHFHCIDTPQKSIAEEKWLCSTCYRRNEHEPLQHYVRDFRRGRKKKRIKELEMGPTNDVELNLVCLNSSSETKSRSGCREDSIMVTLDSDKDDHPKEKKTPFLTFHRRAKKKQVETVKFAEWNSKSEKQQCSSMGRSGHAVEASCGYERSPRICSSKDQSRNAAVLQEQAGMINVEKDAGLVSTPGGGLRETKTTGHGCEGLPSPSLQGTKTSNQNPAPSEPATELPGSKDQPDKLGAAPAIDLNKSSILTEDNNHENSDKISIPLGVNDVSKEKGHPCELKSSVAPLTSTSMNTVKSGKCSMDLLAENFLDSQCPSTSRCPILLIDEETDGRGKELEWLEDLDRVLQDKKTRNTLSVMDCGQASSRKASFTVPNKSSDKGASPEYMYQMTNLHPPAYKNKQHEDTSYKSSTYTNFLGVPECEQQHHGESLNRSALFTNYLGLSLPLNCEAPSISGIKGNIHTPFGHSPWHASDETSFLSRHKKLVENDRNGTSLLFSERQRLMAEMFGKYSNEWSEEELDFLWIGVRRHGMTNWNAILRDPELHFLESRTVDDLSIQWDVEQRKLHTGTFMKPLRLSKTDCSSSSSSSRVIDDVSLARPIVTSSEFPMFASDTKLSLGDVYRQRRNLFISSGESLHPKDGNRHQIPIRALNTRYDWGPSILQQSDGKIMNDGHETAGPSASSDLPHWLKEVLIKRNASAQSISLPPGLLKGEPLAPLKDSWGRGILKRKRVGYGNKDVSSRIHGAPPSQNSLLDYTTLENSGISNQNRTSKLPVGPSNLVVIDSDASSEETISDDQNS